MKFNSLFFSAALLLPGVALAQSHYPTAAGGGSNAAPLVVLGCLNASNVAIPQVTTNPQCAQGGGVIGAVNQGTGQASQSFANSWNVNIFNSSGSISASNPFAAALVNDETPFNINTGSAPPNDVVVTGAVVNNVGTSYTNGQIAPLRQSTAGALFTYNAGGTIGLAAGSNNIGSVNVAANAPLVAGTASIGTVGLNAGTNYIGNVGSYGVYNSAPTPLTSGSQSNRTLDKYGAAVSDISNVQVPTYSLSGFNGSSYAGVLAGICGSGTKTVAITKIDIDVLSTNTSLNYVLLSKYSTAATGGGPVALTPVANDSDNPPTTASANVFSSAPSPGTPNVFWRANFDAQSSSIAFIRTYHALIPGAGQPIILHNANECVYLVVGSANTGSIGFNIEYQEY